MLSVKPTNNARQFAVIIDSTTRKAIEVLHIVERDSYRMQEDPGLRKALSKYCEIESVVNTTTDEDLVHSLTMKPGFELFPIPANFSKKGSVQRTAVSVTGKAGSGKSHFVAQYVSAYHYMYPKNLIRYVSLNKIGRDPSYAKLLEKKSFQKVLIEANPRAINTALDSGSFENTLFIFDDILDVEIPVCPEALKRDLQTEKQNTYFAKERAKAKAREERRKETMERKGQRYTPPQRPPEITPLTPAELEATLNDQATLARLNLMRGKLIRRCIHDTVHNLLKNGRKYGISVITTTHALFGNNPTAECSKDEAGLIVLFPYANVSNEKLVEYLRDKLCFDLPQARAVTKRTFKNYEFLAVNTTGRKFFLTSHYLEFL